MSEVPERLRLFESLLERLPALVAYWDIDRCNVMASASYSEWLGTDPAAMAGRHISEVLGPDLYELNRPYLDAAYDGKEQRFERTLTDAAGRVRHAQAWYSPDVVDGRTVGIYVLVTDVTEQVEAERAARLHVEQYRALARNIPGIFVLLFDHDLRYQMAEGPGLGAYGLDPASIVGRSVGEVAPDMADGAADRFREALDGGTVTWTRRLSGREFSLTAAPVRDDAGAVLGGLVIGSDVTAARQRERADRALHRIAAATADGASAQEVADKVAAAVLEIFDADNAGVARFGEGTIELVSTVPHLDMPRVTSYGPDDESVFGRVALTGRSQLVLFRPDVAGRARSAVRAGVVLGAGVPVRVKGELWGAVGLGLHHLPPAGTEEEILHRLEDFAAAVATSISSTAAWDALATAAATDGLTGLANRRRFEDQLEQAVAVRDVPASLILLDLDHFKAVNDTYGHQVGDAVLAEVAARMSACTRRGELLARIGGDEFALVLPGADAAKASEVARRLTRAVLSAPVAGHAIGITCGVASRSGRDPVPDADALYADADADLYLNKRRRAS